MASLRTVHTVHAEGLIGSLEGKALVVSVTKYTANLLLRETKKVVSEQLVCEFVNILF